MSAPQNLHVLDEQDQLTVFSFEAKLQAQIAGLGCGYLPVYLAEPYLKTGELVAKVVETERYSDTAYFGWRESSTGLAATWWRERLQAYAAEGVM